MFSAAVLPWLKATSQCSIRIRRPPWITLSYSAMSPGRVDPRRRRPQAGVDVDPAAVGRARARRCGRASRRASAPAPITTASASSRRPRLGDHVGDAAVGALEAVELVVAEHGDPVLLEPVLEEPPGLLAEPTARAPPARASPSCRCCRARSATRPPRWRCRSRRSGPRACRRRPRGSRRCCRACAGSGCPRAPHPGTSAGARWRRWRPAPCRS